MELKKFEDILVQCIEDIKAGRSSIEDCLVRYSSMRGQLEPLLRIALEIREPPDVKPSPSFKVKARVWLMDRIHAGEAVTKWPWSRYNSQVRPIPNLRRFSMAKVIVAAVAIGVVVLAVLGVVYGIPGQAPEQPLGTGTLKLYLSDAPLDAENVTGVYITINEIQYHLNGQWITSEEFQGPQKYNLLELTGGNISLLGNFTLPAGNYTQIRFMLDIAEKEKGSQKANPGCYIEFADNSTAALFIPSGGQSGYKATGQFEVTANKTVEVTADFDVRKPGAVHLAGSRYILNPTIKLIVNDQAEATDTEDGTIEDSEESEQALEIGTLELYLSDAPLDAENVTGVYITINEIQYHLGNQWVTCEEFVGNQTYDLLELTGGNITLLGNFTLPAGNYTQIRFMLDIPEVGSSPANPGCYIEFADNSTEPLFVPSGNETGYKAIGRFEVTANETVEVTADFDVRKAVVVAGSRYILNPTIKLIVNEQSDVTVEGSDESEQALETGALALYLSDAPIDAENVTGVYITINEIQYHLDGQWITCEEFVGNQTYDLLELTGENITLLGNFTLPAGNYTQIRFMLDIAEMGSQKANPGCYIEFADNSTEPLFVPSGNETGYKAIGQFEVPANGTVEVTADFDVREAVVVADSSYILKPTIKLTVND